MIFSSSKLACFVSLTPNQHVGQRPCSTNQKAWDYCFRRRAHQLRVAGHTRRYGEGIQPPTSARGLHRGNYQNLHAQHQAPGCRKSTRCHMLFGRIVICYVCASWLFWGYTVQIVQWWASSKACNPSKTMGEPATFWKTYHHRYG